MLVHHWFRRSVCHVIPSLAGPQRVGWTGSGEVSDVEFRLLVAVVKARLSAQVGEHATDG